MGQCNISITCCCTYGETFHTGESHLRGLFGYFNGTQISSIVLIVCTAYHTIICPKEGCVLLTVFQNDIECTFVLYHWYGMGCSHSRSSFVQLHDVASRFIGYLCTSIYPVVHRYGEAGYFTGYEVLCSIIVASRKHGCHAYQCE